MALHGQVATAGTGAIGFDTAIPLTAATAGAYRRRGFRFCIRYVSRTDESRAKNMHGGVADLSDTEGDHILSAGLGLMVVQHVARTGWIPAPALGTSYGANAARYCREAGLPPGVCVWLDLEDCPRQNPHEDTIGYVNAWFAEVAGAGYVPGVYIGFNVWLSPDDLFLRLTTRHYWRAAGHIPDVSHRGYQLFQHLIRDANGRELDQNVAKPDAFGDAALWLERAT